MLISVVFSFRNEEKVIPELIRRLELTFDRLPGYRREYIFVDDDSSDRSCEILRERIAQGYPIKVITMSRRFGGEECFLAGIRYASGDAVITLDSDLQDPPELIPELVQHWQRGADIVYTVRTERAGEPRLKLVMTWLAYRLIHFFSDIRLPKDAGIYKLMSRRATNELLKLQEREPFIRGLIQWVGFHQVAVPYRREPRFAGEAKFRFYDPYSIKQFLTAMISFSDSPLYLTFTVGAFVSLLAFMNLFHVILKKVLGMNLPGWSAIMSSVLLLGGIQMLATGILALYVAKIHKEVKRRPHYIVKATHGFADDVSRPDHREDSGHSIRGFLKDGSQTSV